MIESKILGAAVGIQRQDVMSKSKKTPLPSLTNGVIIGRFKRGRMDKPFLVTADNYKAMLGCAPLDKSYVMVEDAFNRGVEQLYIRRIGSPIPNILYVEPAVI